MLESVHELLIVGIPRLFDQVLLISNQCIMQLTKMNG